MSPSLNLGRRQRQPSKAIYNGGGTDDEVIHSLNGRRFPHSGQDVAEYWTPQCGQTPWFSNVSNGFRHLPHTHNAPCGGAVLQTGQA